MGQWSYRSRTAHGAGWETMQYGTLKCRKKKLPTERYTHWKYISKIYME